MKEVMRSRFMKKTLLLIPVALLLVAVGALAGCGGATEGTITIAGSTTVQPLAEKLAGVFEEDNPDASILVQGGGSSVGVTAAADGTVDIGAASRELKESEPALVKHLLARDGVAIVVHPSNEVTGLTTEQVRDIFAGVITNWNEVGGTDKSITVIAREEASGTRAAFEELVMEDELITAEAILQISNGSLRMAVSTTPASIGFLSFGYLDSSVEALAIDGVEATAENAKDGSYPVVRPLYLLTKEEPEGLTKDFIDFCLGEDGQEIVSQEGYIAVN